VNAVLPRLWIKIFSFHHFFIENPREDSHEFLSELYLSSGDLMQKKKGVDLSQDKKPQCCSRCSTAMLVLERELIEIIRDANPGRPL